MQDFNIFTSDFSTPGIGALCYKEQLTSVVITLGSSELIFIINCGCPGDQSGSSKTLISWKFRVNTEPRHCTAYAVLSIISRQYITNVFALSVYQNNHRLITE
ncbi:hypothetical protein PoB_005268700 [Plakobranchus ocellatus]|uniref:Uncharacterized protein n=1 Tax=Plakobranchus ocellatus TaxID=259542 RepID=A0AAV4C4A3_9GAST|nr:hypothetical protein PoB_005268700 [Plakobranchus ocellatus]